MKPKQTALITGGSSGLGKELAELFARDGVDLILVARNEERLRQVGDSIVEAHGVSVEVLSYDLAKPSAPSEIYARLAESGRSVDYLINNAGFGQYGAFADVSWEASASVMQVNMTALAELTKLFLPQMIERGAGKILNVASTSAFQPGPLISTYFASRSFVVSFSQALSNELEGTGVSATVLCPGSFLSGSNEHLDEAAKAKLPAAREVAELGYRALSKGQAVAIHGLMNRIMGFMARLAPRGMVVRSTRKILEQTDVR